MSSIVAWINNLFPTPRFAANCRSKNQENQYIRGSRVIIIGGTHGIGLAMAQRFVELGAIVDIAGRNEQNGTQIAASFGPKSRFYKSDLSTIYGMNALCDEIEATRTKIDYLILSAGGPPLGTCKLTQDDIETGFAVQCLSRFYLAKRLLPRTQKGILMIAAPSTVKSEIDFSDIELRGEQYQKKNRVRRIMDQAQRDSIFLDCIVMRIAELYPKLVCMHMFPGLINTIDSSKKEIPAPLRWTVTVFGPLFMNDAKTWADVPIYALTSCSPGAHLINSFQKPQNTSLLVLDARNRSALWKYAEQKVQIDPTSSAGRH